MIDLFQQKLIVVFAVAFVVALFVTPLSIRLASKIGAIDIPLDERRVHKKPIPRFGGLGIFAGINGAALLIIFLLYTSNYNEIGKAISVLIIGVFVYLLGAVDDIKRLPAKVKLIFQILAGIATYLVGVKVDFIENYFGQGLLYLPSIAGFIITVLWIVGLTNTINLIDGVDGLASGVAVIASFCISYIAYNNGMYLVCALMLTIAGSGLGFLPYNFYPAKTFMGDGGALYLGYCIAGFSLIGPLKGATLVAVIIPVIVLGLPIIDTLFAIVRRAFNGKHIMEPDKEHIHHRLMKAGMGQRRTVLTLYGICAIMGIAAVLFSRKLYVETFGLMLIAFLYIYIVLASPKKK